VLYELLVGKVPFSGKTPYAIINDHIYEPLPLPSDYNPDISPAVEAVLLQALTKDREDRYPSAKALVAALKEALESPPAEVVSEVDTQRMEIPSFSTSEVKIVATAPSTQAKSSRLKKNSRHKIWLWWFGWITAMGAAGAFAAVLVSMLIVVPNRLNNLPTSSASTRTLYNVPTLTHDEARAAIDANPNDPIGYLALVRVQLDANDLRGIRRTITEGVLAVEDDARFELTAAKLAVESGHPDAAFVIYASVLSQSEGSARYEEVRSSAGEAMYELATHSERLRPAQVIGLNAELENMNSPLVKAMIARAMLSSENTRLAQLNIAAALNGDTALAEAHLVNGELRQPSNAEIARAEWETARDTPDAPQWVRDRATELLATLI
jgi:hypothetical protein